jgi:hypothetical protein
LENVLKYHGYKKLDFSNMKHEQYVDILRKILCLGALEVNDYVLTMDNFYKIVLIYLRVRANIPVILMGETGCGKTSLVKFTAETMFKGIFKIIPFHAGINETQILAFMDEVIASSASLEKVWVLLDEVNTCNHLGLISEIICEHTMLGEPLPGNIQFIATCNPYRMKRSNFEIGLFSQNTSTNNSAKYLAYTVNPLPHSMMNFVFNFGSLSPEDEILYISKILTQNKVSPLLIETASALIHFS